ncbi:putative sigma intracellular receptor 2, EXPERA domain-containing protein [Helianthus annuus]|uniref:sigma intracellular receptor 2 isoform X2 n=1 Tax=Helianthus annuus TaxID=4232 RepID=UPI000B8FC449|nr:sigma intracellular receptor 2 isoform X2 [Helianthus annuus]KAJ0429470.1 putative sigma intracellular receptor 2, EXPERA domain-containing protein [Helianthus annuus]KAJ0636599.1 putative sigma intracellular receptor 2, EXPERA domain-containing protein [Helianthus annuus]KAJ0668024.1 putative sigma intracellular receptor 2, EXPERA domain-containing protein [Helianthus annuus]
MGALMKLVDAILFVFFLIIVIAAPLLDGQSCLPSNIFPDILVRLNTWYAHEYGDYLVSEKPHFFVGLVWLELVFAWPLSVASLYGIVAGKSWLPTTCLMYGVSTLTAMVAILSEMVGSGKASEKLLKMYYPFLGFAVLAILRGLLPHSSKSNASVTRPAVARKKRA